MALTDCNLITGDTVDCRDSQGGIEEIYITEFQNKNVITSSSGTITAHSMVAGKQYWRWELGKENAEATENGTSSVENGSTFYEGTLTFSIKKWNAEKRNKARLLLLNRLLVIIKWRNGKYSLAGQTAGCDGTIGETKTGKAYGDMSGINITITWKEPDAWNEVTSSIIPNLLIPA